MCCNIFLPAENRRRDCNVMKKRDHISIGWFYLLLGSMFLLWTCSQTIEPVIGQESKTREFSMSNGIEKGTPLIDTAVPSIFETASFGLG